jgi:hypothetical protein
MKTLKEEQVRGHQWRDLDALRADLRTFLQITYNHQRPHSKPRVAQPLGHGFGGNGGAAHGVARVDFDELLEYAGS